ncbi:MAG: choice-of-anchor L domain-containing protein [Deltaproteobacteria bacterium]|nr:choice-of-anchor L domain-containing protein [Nannocystaceae bacterium]
MRAQPSLGAIAATYLLVACGLDARKDEAETAGITTLSTLSDAQGTSSGAAEGSSDGAAGNDDSDPPSASSEGSSSDGGGPNAPKFDIGSVTGGSEDECASGQDDDADGDGWTPAQGDCNDCDANANPGAIEVVINQPDDTGEVPAPADEDCDGGIDNVQLPCDGGFALDDDDALSAAAVIGLCKVAQGVDDYGILSADWVRANGTVVAPALQFGLQDDFGANVDPQEGAQLLALSSGNGRLPGQAGSCGNLSCYGTGAGDAPAGFPQDVPGCAGASDINDDIALEVTLRAPTNATGFSYNFDFYSFEYPEWVCTSFNDQYIALVEPAPVGSIDGNISFDSLGNPVSVNIAFFDVCDGCGLGTAELSGTGFDTWDDAGATSWLVTTAPVTGGSEITIRFAIWDTGDQAWDSTVLIDNFRWIADGADVDVGTEPEG